MNRVNPIPVASLGKFYSAGFREQLDLTLDCGVGGEAGSALNPDGGGDVDDNAALAAGLGGLKLVGQLYPAVDTFLED